MFVTVDIDEAVTLAETGMSGDQIHERPCTETDELDTEIHSLLHLMDVATQIIDALIIFQDAFFRPGLLVSETALCDQQRQVIPFP